MNKLIRGLIVVLAMAFLLMYIVSRLNASTGQTEGNILTVYNWGDYIDPELIAQFEKETGMKVIYETFDSNEAMMTKVEQGGTAYDIAIPSEYAIDKMKKNNLLLPVNHRKLPNLKYIDRRFLNLPFDRDNQYSIPYFWGTVGILYNKDLMGGKKITSWADLWDESYKNDIFLMDSAREVMGMGLNTLGYSLNETNKERLMEAKEKLDELTPNIKAIVGDEIRLLMLNGEAKIGVVWSGTASEVMYEKDHLEYVVPKEGSNLWFDNMVIPKTAKNVEGAHKFINFMLDPKVAARNAEYVGYSTPNKKALDYLPKEVVNDRRFYPDDDMTKRLEVYENLGPKMLAYYNELFLEFKMHRK
ncbi:ABC transporter substrate-binding protein [Bacillus xiapuensis]|uniref:ABC transporter substrate-binding protein n=1 Tax=Bacillus xiapuensis TaxID=2014075 RepID=UPI000C246A73|nr:ABC transporter substrate-binding protein [Bacillus xiapuensis]